MFIAQFICTKVTRPNTNKQCYMQVNEINIKLQSAIQHFKPVLRMYKPQNHLKDRSLFQEVLPNT